MSERDAVNHIKLSSHLAIAALNNGDRKEAHCWLESIETTAAMLEDDLTCHLRAQN